MKLKKLLTLVLAGALMIAPVIAGVGSNAATLVAQAAADDEVKDNEPTEPTTPGGSGTGSEGDKEETGKPSTPTTSSSSSSKKPAKPVPVKSAAELKAEEEARKLAEEEEAIAKEKAAVAEAEARVAAQVARESEAAALAAQASGIPMSTSVQAAGENKSVGEYMNNAVTEVPGLTDVTPVGQGGKVVIDGVVTNHTFSVQKPLSVQVQSAQTQAAQLGGTILNVTDIKGIADFETATVNFYMPGVAAGQNIQVYQLTDGTWNSVTVSEIREDHVVVDMTSYGVFAFIEVPAQ